ncbi:hypothetical protein BJ980_003397 [Nocardioides daedukensis]|uniref:DUF1795 domain-containing protein n=1 Tax=Nocardioides daedukensis TaxID=634462 RepID=A0A7Y9S653_9ACTN|nr:hypothetical protein [Nocardioides daedukensis]NYG60474.1 hypothetical protein [Nocardioides daedukensis]
MKRSEHPSHPTRARFLAPALAPALAAVLGLSLLGACGGDDEPDAKKSASPSPSATAEPSASETALRDTDFGRPATGKTVKGKGYTYRMPKGWVKGTPLATDPSIDSVAEEADADDGFLDNITVAHQKAPAGSTLDELEASVASQLAKTVPDLDVQPRVVLDGVEALHYRGAAKVDSVRYFLEELVTIDDKGAITVITFSFSPELGATSRTKLVDSVLASWSWRATKAKAPKSSSSPSAKESTTPSS